jgi:hypothetical protein
MEVAPFYADKRTDGHDTSRSCLASGPNSLRHSDICTVYRRMCGVCLIEVIPFSRRHQLDSHVNCFWLTSRRLLTLCWLSLLCRVMHNCFTQVWEVLSLWLSYWPSEEQIFAASSFCYGNGVLCCTPPEYTIRECGILISCWSLGLRIWSTDTRPWIRCLASWHERRQGWVTRRSDQT